MTKIEWVVNPDGTQGKTWNPVVGCSKVSIGCKHCFAERMANRLKAMGRPEYQDAVNGKGRWTGRVMLVPGRLEEPLKRRKPTTYFVNSMSDLFHESLDFESILKVFDVMRVATRHIFQILTKRPARAVEYFAWETDRRGIQLIKPPHIWLGVSTENQETADGRIPALLQTPAALRFVSAEPLLGPLDLNQGNYGSTGFWVDQLDWLIVGGESGPDARPMELDWARSLRDQAVSAGVPYFFKQHGGQSKVNGTWGGNLLDGREWNEFPEVNGE